MSSALNTVDTSIRLRSGLDRVCQKSQSICVLSSSTRCSSILPIVLAIVLLAVVLTVVLLAILSEILSLSGGNSSERRGAD